VEENSMDNRQKENSVTASYMRKSKSWIFEVCDSNNKLIDIKYIKTFKLDFSGKLFKSYVEMLSKNFEKDGITQKQIEEAILKEAKECNIKPPKYLR
jgi:hypothetical protein